MSKWIKKDDLVVVIAGNDKGKTGKVLRRLENRVVVQGVNVRKKHMKSRNQNVRSSIIEMEMPVDISNIAFSDQEGNPVKLKVRLSENGKKELVYLSGSQEVVHRTLKEGLKN